MGPRHAHSRAEAAAQLRSRLSWLPWVRWVYLTRADDPFGVAPDSILVLYDAYQWWIPRTVTVERDGAVEIVEVLRHQAPMMDADTVTREELQQAHAERRRDRGQVDT